MMSCPLRKHLPGLFFLVNLVACPLFSQQAAPVPEVGRMADIPGAHETPNPAIDYKIVFDLKSTAEKIDDVNPGLTTIATLENAFAHFNVPKDHLHFVVIFHGPTVDLILNDDAYRQRHDGHANPNSQIMKELSAAGVQLAVCGQSALQHKIDPKNIRPDVQVNYSATVTFMNLQMQGYARIEE